MTGLVPDAAGSLASSSNHPGHPLKLLQLQVRSGSGSGEDVLLRPGELLPRVTGTHLRHGAQEAGEEKDLHYEQGSISTCR